MNKDSKIIVAGGTGLVGSAIMRRLRAGGYTNLVNMFYGRKPVENLNVPCIETDMTRQANVEEAFEKEKPECVFLAAAKVGGIVANSTLKAEFIYDNIMIAANVIHAAWKLGVGKIVNLGSSCIYPRLAPQPLKEEYLLSGYLEPTNDAYAMAKIAAIKMCNAYNEQYGTNYISAMPTNLYGPGDNYNLELSHVLPAMIRKMHLGKCLENGDWNGIRRDFDRNNIHGVSGSLPESGIVSVLKRYGIEKNGNGTVITLWGDGSPLREFLYSEDLADAIVYLMENVNAKDLEHGFVNIGSGEDLSIRELADMVKEVTGYGGKIAWDTTKPNGMPRKLLDVSGIHGLGWRRKIGMREGIDIVYNNYIK